MKKSYLISAVTAVVLLSACGGGDSSNSTPLASIKVTGQFIDSAVKGLTYSCSSGTHSITNVNGDFTCNVGDTVTFSINEFKIGSAIAQSIITPATLYKENHIAITNLAQLLQTLDSDNNVSNGITIDSSSQAVQSLNENTQISFSQIDFDSAITSYIGKTLIDEATANTHLDLSLKNITNDKGITKESLVYFINGSTQEYCLTQGLTNDSYANYDDYQAFVDAGGSSKLNFYENSTQSCDTYSTAGECISSDVSELVHGNGSCVTIITFPKEVIIYGQVITTNHITTPMGTKTWLPATTEEMSPKDAIDFCTQLGGRLPTFAEFFEANQQDIGGFTKSEYVDRHVFYGKITEGSINYILNEHEEIYGVERYKRGPFVGSIDGYDSISDGLYLDEGAYQQSNTGNVRCIED